MSAVSRDEAAWDTLRRMNTRAHGPAFALAFACSVATAACGSEIAIQTGTTTTESGSGASSSATTTGAGGATTTSTSTTTTTTSTTSTSVTKPTAEEACAAYWEAACTEYATCFPTSSLIYFGDHANCLARMTAACTSGFSAPGTTSDPAQTAACASALVGLPCAQYTQLLAREIDLGVCSGAPGALADGAACGAASQCASLVCDVPTDQPCGQCAAGQLGDPCDGSKGCEIGLRCAQGTCVSPGQFSEACNPSKPCSAIFYCTAGACADRLPEGSMCNPTAFDSPCQPGLTCNPLSKKCETFDAVPLGATCGLGADNKLDYCQHGTYCKLTSATKGTCVGAIADGQACQPQPSGFEPCTYPSRCFQGVCRYPDAAACD